MRRNIYPGTLIVFEGTDGAGKTTMIAKTKEYLSARFGTERILLEKQPTDLSRKTRLFQKMMYCSRHEEINYRAVQLLTLSDRVQHNQQVIVPANRHLNEELLHNVAKEFLVMQKQADFHVLDTSQSADAAFLQVKNELDIYFKGKNE